MRDHDAEILLNDDRGPGSDVEDPTEPVTIDLTRLERLSSKAKDLSDKLSTVGVDGRGPWKGSIQIAEEHRTTHGNVEKAIQRLIATHVRVAASTGFLAGLGGLITLPVMLPADLAALWLTQARLAGAIAHLRGTTSAPRRCAPSSSSR